LVETQAGAAEVDFVAGTEFFAAAAAGRDFDGTAVAEDAGAEFTAVVDQAVFSPVANDVGVAARDGCV
jgi:hypothetical protein